MLSSLKELWYRTTHWETWHYHLKYIPLYPAWIWYCIRARSLWFFTSSNPTLTFGGFEGESKREMYEQLPPGSFPKSLFVSSNLHFDTLIKQIEVSGLKFPLAVKPDVGMMGFLFRRIESPEALKLYHEKMPVDYLVQTLVEYSIEVSVFYYRRPDQVSGTITGFIRKEYLKVTGDGISTLLTLMENHPRARLKIDELKSKHSNKLNDIIPAGQHYYLSLALNLSRGGRLISLEHEKDDRLLGLFDSISHYNGNFFYGRYDIKCNSIEDLKLGKNFSILEYNGSGAEPHHVYGNGNNLFQAYRILLHHWKMLYTISSYNNRNGHPYWTFGRGWVFLRTAKKHFRLLKQLDVEMPVFN
ncbi:MAG: hypothetical protein EOO04_30820 [Chitinophagaceae bacterium]|nr:MAG: hypothetical protein EOO04_30820 [Chitinophagaceae bacterium]